MSDAVEDSSVTKKPSIVTMRDGEEIEITLSDGCDAQLAGMLSDKNFILNRQMSSMICKYKTQATLTSCCSQSSYALGTFYSCTSDCEADCRLQTMADFCEYYGKTCEATYKPISGDPSVKVPVQVRENVCIPTSCDNSNDRAVMFQLPAGNSAKYTLNPNLYYYPQHLSVSHECPSNLAQILIALAITVLSIAFLGACAMYLFKPPRTNASRAAAKAHNKNAAIDKFLNQGLKVEVEGNAALENEEKLAALTFK